MTTTKPDAVRFIPTTPTEVAKAIVYIALTALGVLALALKDGEVTGLTYLTAGLAVVTLVPVYFLSGTLVKTIVAFVSAALQGVILLLGDGIAFSEIQPADYIGVLFTAFAAIGVLVVPNAPLGTGAVAAAAAEKAAETPTATVTINGNVTTEQAALLAERLTPPTVEDTTNTHL